MKGHQRPGPLGSLAIVAGCVVGFSASPLEAQRNAPATAPFVIDHYYRVKSGHFEEFFRLLKKNRIPLLKKEMDAGRIVRMDAVRPRLHSQEEHRWDLRLTIAWRDAATAWDDLDPSRFVSELFPDKATYDREEQVRLDLLLERWDIPVNEAPLYK